MTRKLYLWIRPVLITLFFCGSSYVMAQYSAQSVFGVRAGMFMSQISGVDKLLVSEDYYSGYSFTNDYVLSPRAELFFTYRITNVPIAIEASAGYMQNASTITYIDVKDFTYSLDMAYHSVVIGGAVKGYIFRGLNIGAGLKFGLVVTDDKLDYTSNAAELSWGGIQPPSDEETCRELREVIKARNLVEFVPRIGYDFAIGLSVEANMCIGLNDCIETLANRYDLAETSNKSMAFGLSVGYAISIGEKADWRYKR